MASVRPFAKMGQQAKAELVKRLTKLGEDAMRYAFERGYSSVQRSPTSAKAKKGDMQAWTDVKGNLRDSFASAVYVDGILQSETIKFFNEAPTSKHGRRVAEDYLKKIHPNMGKNMVTVVVVAAMQYTQYLESGRHRGGYKIRVVSSAKDFIDRNYWAYVYDVYKRFEIAKPQVKVVRGDIYDTSHADYVPANRE